MEEKTYHRIVVKVGTSTLTRTGGVLNLQNMDHLARVLSDLHGCGYEIILVSSGAIAFGVGRLGLAERPTELRKKQACAAVGQCEMMHLYDKFFGEYGKTVAQILLTGDDVDNRRRAEHLAGTFATLLSYGCIPIVNENDSVSSAEIETGRAKVLGDNDTLSAIVAKLCGADLLVLLSDIDGLYDADPHKNPDAKRIERVTALTAEILASAGGAASKWATGGMCTKLAAANVALTNGFEMVIANGARAEDLYEIVAGAPIGTRFCKEETK